MLLGPRVVIDPSFGIGISAWKAKIPTPNAVQIGSASTMLLQAELGLYLATHVSHGCVTHVYVHVRAKETDRQTRARRRQIDRRAREGDR